MRVIIYPSDATGCGQYRLRWPGQAVAAQGYDVRISPRQPAIVVKNNKIVAMGENLNADIVVFQRPCRKQYLEVFRVLQKDGIKVVVDMDDDLTDIHRNNPAYGPYNYLHLPDMHWKFGSEACELADIVTVTTPRLQEVYGGVVVPNCIPEWYLGLKRPQNDLVTVGWAGLTATHPEDLQVTHGAINQALSSTKGLSRFLALGDQKTMQNLGIKEGDPNQWIPGVPIQTYPEFVSQLDIGLAPLADTPFNEAKSWLKALEYASLGVVPVVSPNYDNMRMVEAGAAILASNPSEWKERVTELIRDDDMRSSLAAKAREFAATQTLEGNTHRWAEAWGLV